MNLSTKCRLLVIFVRLLKQITIKQNHNKNNNNELDTLL